MFCGGQICSFHGMRQHLHPPPPPKANFLVIIRKFQTKQSRGIVEVDKEAESQQIRTMQS